MSDTSRSRGAVDALIRNDEELRIVMVGKTGAGKSATGNTILGFKAFEAKFRTRSVTVNCQKGTGVMAGMEITVIDTPGLFDTTFSKEETIREITQCISLASPGPHVFLIVIQLGRFTEEEQKSVEIIQEMFGQISIMFTMILFTHGDSLGDEPIEEMINDDPKLRGVIDTCEGRYHVFNNKTQDLFQITELLVKIKSMVWMNGGSHYTTEMFQAAEREREEQKQRLLRENEEKRRKETEQLRRRIEREAQQEAERKMMRERQKQEARIAKENERRRREMEEMQRQTEYMREALRAREMEALNVNVIGALLRRNSRTA